MLADRQGTYLYLNHTADGMRMEDLIHKATIFDFVAPEQHASTRDVLRRVFERGETVFYEAWVPRIGRWYANVAAPLRRDGVVIAASIMTRDVTTQKQAERASQETNTRYRQIVESTRDGIWLLDADANTTFVNARLAEMLGYTSEEMLGKNLLEFMDEERKALARAHFAHRVQGEHEVHDFCFRRKDGRELWALVSASPLYDAQRQFSGAMAIVTDDTERRRLSQAVTQAQKMDAVGRLAGGMAHEFSNLLTSILGFGGMLELALADREKERVQVGYILEAAERARTLVRQLLTFARREQFEPRVVDLRALLGNLRPMLQSVLKTEVSLNLELSDGPSLAHVDPSQIEQALLNLVINARDAIAGQGTIDVSLRHELTGGDAVETVSCPRIALTVRDDGAGIHAGVREHIFEPFFTTKDAERGTGLGLSIVYSIARQNGGSISVESTLGHGSAFTLRFPRLASSLAV
jgi:PAS domain S-box-containing protein